MKKKIVFSLALCKKRYKKINSQRLEQCGQNKLNLLSTTVNNGNQEHTSLYTNKKSVRLTNSLFHSHSLLVSAPHKFSHSNSLP